MLVIPSRQTSTPPPLRHASHAQFAYDAAHFVILRRRHFFTIALERYELRRSRRLLIRTIATHNAFSEPPRLPHGNRATAPPYTPARHNRDAGGSSEVQYGEGLHAPQPDLPRLLPHLNTFQARHSRRKVELNIEGYTSLVQSHVTFHLPSAPTLSQLAQARRGRDRQGFEG